MLSLIFAQLLTILLTGGLRFGPAAVLFGGGQTLWIALITTLALALGLALGRDVRAGRAPWLSRGRLLLWLVFPAGAAISWGLGQTTLVGGLELPALAAIIGLVIAVLLYRHREWTGRETSRGAWLTAARWVLVPTAAGVFVVLRNGTTPAEGMALVLATYPLYAVAQLGAALVLPWTQWERDGISPGWRVFGITMLFGMVHWPNPFATVVTAAGMALWALAWRAGSALIPLALSMGMLAAVVTQYLPDTLTGHMRISANYVLTGSGVEHQLWLDGEADRINQLAAFDRDEGLRPWLTRALAIIEGEPVDEALVDATAHLLERLHREQTVRWIFHSEEFRFYAGIDSGLEIDELRFFGSTFVPHHPKHAPYFELVDQGAYLSHRDFLQQIYQTLLRREPRDSEYEHWPEHVPTGTRWQYVRRVLDGGGLRFWKVPDSEEERARIMEMRRATRP